MACLKYILPVVLLLSACGSDGDTVTKEEVERDLGLSPGYTETEAAHVARQFVHRKVPYDFGTGSNEPTDDHIWNPKKYHDLVDGKLSLQCGEQSHAYQYLLSKLGIEGRTVWLQAEEYDGSVLGSKAHQTAEVYTDGKWWLSDPTFDLYWECDGKADATEIQNCPNPIPFAATEGSFTIYDLPYSYLDYFYNVAYTYTIGPDGKLTFPVQHRDTGL